MPKGFLVKRQRNHTSYSWRRRSSVDERSDSGSGSEVDVPVLQVQHVGSPDSCFSQSPVNLCFRPEAPSSDVENRPPSPITPIKVCDSPSPRQDKTHLEKVSCPQKDPPFSRSDSRGSPPRPRLLDPRARGFLGPASPLSVSTCPPFYFPAFDRLSVTSPNAKTKLTINGNFIGLHATTNISHLQPFPTKLSSPQQAARLAEQHLSGIHSGLINSQPVSPDKQKGQNISPKKRAHDGDSNLASKPKSCKKTKAIRRIQFEEADKRSPVSGTIIKEYSDTEEEGIKVTTGDIDSSLNFVEVTPEARAEIEKIDNKIGDYDCQLCKEHYDDAFQLAQHRCSRIVHVEYRCPECDKVFNCPANLASHRRWHKPRTSSNNNNNNTKTAVSSDKADCDMKNMPGERPSKVNVSLNLDAVNGNIADHNGNGEPELCRNTPSPVGSSASDEGNYECSQCGKRFRRSAYLRKHLLTHTEDPFPCHLCGKGFRGETARAKHMLQHSLDNMTGMNSIEIKEAVTCPICQQPFSTKAALERHSKIHSGEVYNCKYCTAVFYSSPGLTRHINKCHPTENRQVILLQMPHHVGRPC